MAVRPHKAPCLLLRILKHKQICTNNESLKCEGLKLDKCSGHLSNFPTRKLWLCFEIGWRRSICRTVRHQHLSAWNIFVYQLWQQLLSFFLTPSLSLSDPLPLFLSSLSCHNPTCSWPKPPLLWNSLSRPTERVCQHLSTLICPSLSACASACICVCADLTPCAACNMLWGFTRNRG